jgi:hypothetical protein
MRPLIRGGGFRVQNDPKIFFAKALDDIRDDPHNSPPSLIAANENEAIKTNCSLKIYSR